MTPAATPQPQPPSAGWHFVDWGCELAGTALLVLGGTTAVVGGFAHFSPLAQHLRSVHRRHPVPVAEHRHQPQPGPHSRPGPGR